MTCFCMFLYLCTNAHPTTLDFSIFTRKNSFTYYFLPSFPYAHTMNTPEPSIVFGDINDQQARTIAEGVVQQTIVDASVLSVAEKPSKSRRKLGYLSPKWISAAHSIGRIGHVRIYDIRLTRTDQIATAFGVDVAKALKSLGNGRTFAPWGEMLCQLIKLVILHLSNDVKGSDGITPTGEKVSIKSLTSLGLKLQQSGFTGKNRTCTHADLVFSIGAAQFHVAVDITRLHCIRVTCFPKELALAWAEKGMLTASGISTSAELQGLIDHTALSGNYEELNIDDLDPSLSTRNKQEFDLWLAQQVDHDRPFDHSYFKSTASALAPEVGLAEISRQIRDREVGPQSMIPK